MIKELASNNFSIANGKVTLKGVSKPGLVLIWAGFCGHCTRFKPVYNQIDQALDGGFQLYALEDKQMQKELGQSLGIRGYPTLKFIDSKGTVGPEYNGERTMQSILEHICKFYHFCMATF